MQDNDFYDTNKERRFELYQLAAQLLGYRSCTPLPLCLELYVKHLFPDNHYVGFVPR
ncbi:hypothetical protein H9P43_008058 [Blastocladiella emersonii ATCC 22665]|nr:hypothetical protein H9P43_008047 [Blastocladiella emersonii ATCC 22665]KAI9164231.1 hypothetical protein H9P43_008058 [Blastocladiella emersonii ATCC 22665]